LPVFGRRTRTVDDAHLRGIAAALDSRAASAIRPWYVDDGWWAACGPGYSETPIVESVVRPYVARVPGSATWSWDGVRFDAHLDVDSPGSADLVLPSRCFPDGVTATVDGSAVDATPLLSIDLASGHHDVVVRARG